MKDSGGPGGAPSVAIDVQLVAAARSGSARAFDVLVDRYHASLAAYLGRLLGDRELAEDVTQETFFAAYRALHRLSDEHTFSAWLYRIARDRASSALRRRAIVRFVSLDALGDRMQGWFGRHSALDDVPTRHAIQAALDALPLGEREALLLHSLAGFTAREIAEILRISPDAAARRVSRGSQRFRQLYRGQDDAATDNPEGGRSMRTTTDTAATCQFPRERLVAYRDGDLRAAQLEIVQAHLAACEECRRWLGELEGVEQLLRNATPRHDDPATRARIKTGVEQLPPPRQRRASVLARGRVFALTLLAVVALLGLSFWRQPLVDGGSSFTRWLESTNSARQPNGGARVSAPEPASPIARLPEGLTLEPGGTDAGQLHTRYLRGADGLALQLVIDRSGGGQITLPDDPEHSEIVGVAGHDVLVLFGQTRDDVTALFWTDGAVRYQTLVVSAPLGGFRLDAALRVAAALMAVDWSVS